MSDSPALHACDGLAGDESERGGAAWYSSESPPSVHPPGCGSVNRADRRGLGSTALGGGGTTHFLLIAMEPVLMSVTSRWTSSFVFFASGRSIRQSTAVCHPFWGCSSRPVSHLCGGKVHLDMFHVAPCDLCSSLLPRRTTVTGKSTNAHWTNLQCLLVLRTCVKHQHHHQHYHHHHHTATTNRV